MKTKKTKKTNQDPKAKAMAAAAVGRPEAHAPDPFLLAGPAAPKPAPPAYKSVIDLARGLGLSFNFMARLDQTEFDTGASTDLAMAYAVSQFNRRHRREIFWAHPTTHQPGTAPGYYCLWEVDRSKTAKKAFHSRCAARFLMNGPFRVVLRHLHAGLKESCLTTDNPSDSAVTLAEHGLGMTTTVTASAHQPQPAKRWKFKASAGPSKTVIHDEPKRKRK